MKILVSDPLSEEGLKILNGAGIPVDVRPGLKEDALCEIIGGYDGLMIRSGTTVTRNVIDAGKKLVFIGRAGVGVDNIDVPYATERGILVMNTPSANIISAAEHSLAMIMSLARKIPNAHASVHEGKWERGKFTGIELFGKTLGIIGVGRVGGEIARRAKSFEMKLIGYDPYLPQEVADSLGVRLTTLDEVLRESDIMTVHTPLLPETKNLISEAQFEMMKPNALLVNVARGGIVNEDDLYKALKSKRIAGAAFDVFVDEPLKSGCNLLELDNLIMTPHLGASTKEAQEKVSVELAETVVRFLKEGLISNAINAPRGQLDPELVPYVELAERLGICAHQLNGQKPINEVEITFAGDLSSRNTKMVSMNVLIGILKKIVGDNVNMVNVSSIAKGKGIKVTESKIGDSEEYNNILTVSVVSGTARRTVRGTSIANRPRLIGIDEHDFEIVLEDDIIVAVYKDAPGVIGRVGKILGENGINIGNMTVGRDENREHAIMLVGVDQFVAPEIVKEIADIPDFKETKLIDLVEN